MLLRSCSFTITEHDAARPWVVVGREQRTVELPDSVGFYEWARGQWPEERWTIDLEAVGAQPDGHGP